MKLRTRAFALGLIVALAGPLVGANVADADSDDSRLEALAVQQSKLWADGLIEPFDSPLSPRGCDYKQPVGEVKGRGMAVFMLPVNTGLGTDTTPSVRCTVRRTQWILADLGGLVPFEDDNGIIPPNGWELGNGKVVPFTPRTLVKICRDAMTRDIVPFPTTVELDGRSLRSHVEKVITDTFIYRVPENWLLEDDSADLGHPGKLTASYCGYKLLLPPLSVGYHKLVGSAFDRTITWHLRVIP